MGPSWTGLELERLGQEYGIYSEVELCQSEERKWPMEKLQQYLIKTGGDRKNNKGREGERKGEAERSHYPKLLNALSHLLGRASKHPTSPTGTSRDS